MFYQFREQIKNRGCYAGIVLETEMDFNKPLSLNIEYAAEERWSDVCKAAVHIFFDYYKWLEKGELTVKILNVDWLPADTNSLIVLYSVVTALSSKLNVNISDLSFDKENERFVFPESRVLADSVNL